jgi:alkylation response protein AidB-like acyl-CoA dehydrogenase
MSTRRPRTATDLQVPLDRSLTAFRAQVRDFLDRHAPPAVVREHVGAPFDEELWSAMARLDLMATLVPESDGGAGGGFVEGAVLLEELGRALVPAPFLASAVLGALTIAAGADQEHRAEVLPRIADGSLRVAVARGDHASGPFRGVIDAGDAHLLVIVLDDGRLLAAEPEGLTLTREISADPLRATYQVALHDRPARRIGEVASIDVLDAAIATMVAAEMTGGAHRCLELSTEWARLREQFGQPIGAFQAIKHPCVNMLVDVEAATAAVRLAARLGDAGSPDHPAAAWLALATCGRVYRDAAAETIQIHGGSGYVWEHEAHFHLKRAKDLERLFGSTPANRDRLARALGI